MQSLTALRHHNFGLQPNLTETVKACAKKKKGTRRKNISCNKGINLQMTGTIHMHTSTAEYTRVFAHKTTRI